MADENCWRTNSFRQSIVAKIDEAIRTSGMTTSRNSLEMENHVFQKAKTKEEYLGFVARLILHVREIKTKQGGGMAGPGPGQGGPGMPDPINALQNLASQGTRNPLMNMGPQPGQMGGQQQPTATNLLQTLNRGPGQQMMMGNMPGNMSGAMSMQVCQYTRGDIVRELSENWTSSQIIERSNGVKSPWNVSVEAMKQIPQSSVDESTGPSEPDVSPQISNETNTGHFSGETQNKTSEDERTQDGDARLTIVTSEFDSDATDLIEPKPESDSSASFVSIRSDSSESNPIEILNSSGISSNGRYQRNCQPSTSRSNGPSSRKKKTKSADSTISVTTIQTGIKKEYYDAKLELLRSYQKRKLDQMDSIIDLKRRKVIALENLLSPGAMLADQLS